jgi:hypothetical protein
MALEGGEGSASRPGPLFTPGKDQVPIVQEAGWAPGPVWTGAENLVPHQDSIPGPSSPQPLAILTELPGLLKLQELFAYCTLQTSQVVHNETVPSLLHIRYDTFTVRGHKGIQIPVYKN